MTLTLKQVWGKVQRGDKWEVRADYEDESGAIYNETLPLFLNKPSAEDISERAELRRAVLEFRLNNPPPVEPDPMEVLTAEKAELENQLAEKAIEIAAEKASVATVKALVAGINTKDTAKLVAAVEAVKLSVASTGVSAVEVER